MLIIESGGTKSSWNLVGQKEYMFDGINPNIHSEEHIHNILIKAKEKLQDKNIESIEFYGAGCSTTETCFKIETLLKNYFDCKISVNHDLLAACRAGLQNESGLVGILGTGSNACYYDGSTILDEKISLGYILGDEGGGADLGKRLVKLYVENLLPNS